MTYRVVLRNYYSMPMTWIEEETEPFVDDCRQLGDKEVASGLNEAAAEFCAEKEKFLAIEEKGFLIKRNNETKLWEGYVGGTLVITCVRACYTCGFIKPCDFDGDRCSVLS
jgi:hypothetical protein